MKSVDALMQQAVDEKVFPGAVLLVSQSDRIVFHEAYGQANIFTKQKITTGTIFDLASLTKPLATTLAVLLLVKEQRLQLSQELASVLPVFKGTEKEAITVEHLLAHHAGLPDYQPYYLALSESPPEKRKAKLRDLLFKEPLIHPVGKTAVYSDVGFMLLNWIVETVASTTLDCFVVEKVYQPLCLNNLFFPGAGRRANKGPFAATEDCPWRRTVLEGVVHDENAYTMGGVEGHSGLFGTAEDIGRLLRELLSVHTEKNPASIFNQKLLQHIFRRYNDSDRALGFDTPAAQNSSCGRYFSKDSVGHLGFTGTSFWMDLSKKITVVLLTNRVHPSRDNTAIKEFRPKIHNAVMEVFADA
ncbi:serine hydrolase domain-containing protein [Thermodesulfobacteriota bacterium]